MRLRLRLTPKLTLVFILFAALLLVALGVLAYSSGRSALEAATVSGLLSSAIEKEAELAAWVEERQSDIATLVASPSFLDDLTTLATATSREASA